ncbi:MAG: hypothetical protein HY347_03540 [candidate division NC10 bacterium]|nr:hypothetical protein [candidate division NC10 bacterium]
MAKPTFALLGFTALLLLTLVACAPPLVKRASEDPPPLTKVQIEQVPLPPLSSPSLAPSPGMESKRVQQITQEAPPPPASQELPSPAPPAPPPPETKPPPPKPEEKPRFVSLNFESVDLELVLKAFADITGFNFVLAPGVKAQITLHTVNRIPVSEAFSILGAVLEVHNLAAVKKGPIYKIVPIAVAQQEMPELKTDREEVELGEPLITEVVSLEVAQAEELARIITPFLVKGTKIVPHKPTNALILSGFASSVNRLVELIKALDKPSPIGPEQQIFVYYVKNADAKKLAEILNTLFGKRETKPPVPGRPLTSPQPLRPGAPPPAAVPQAQTPSTEVIGEIVVVPDETTNALVIRTAPQNWSIIEETLKKLDVVPKQVVIELLIAELSLTNELRFGLEFFVRSGEFQLQQLFGLAPVVPPALGVPIPQLSGFTLTFINRDQLFALLTAIDAFSRLKVLATPHILTADNMEARIQVGQEVPIVTQEQASLTALTTTTPQPTQPSSNVFRSIQQKDIGVILKVKPHVNEDRLVTLDIEQEVSAILSETTGSIGSPTFSKRTSKSSVVVPDRQTLVIGGIIREDKRREFRGIPFLSRIPGLGWLFRSTTDRTERTELILLLTPHVIASPEEAAAITKQFEERAKALQEQIEQARKDKKGGG